MTLNTETAERAVDSAMAEIADFDLRIEGAAQGMPKAGSLSYIERHRHEYVRTVRDINEFRPPTGHVRVLELGAFFGVNCLALKKLGYDVTAADMPEFMDLPEQIERYRSYSIATKSVRLEEIVLPFADESFDVIIMCEVLEHLNFNPLPLLKEINRIGAVGSIFYLSLPNAANIYNRIRILRGEAIGVSVDSFFCQLDPTSSEIVNEHWREYTAAEVRLMLERLGFRIEKQYFFSLGETLVKPTLRHYLARIFYSCFPFLKENQTTIAVRQKRTALQFRIPATVHKTLREL